MCAVRQAVSAGWRKLVAEIMSPEWPDRLSCIHRLGSIGQEGVCTIDALKDNLISEQQVRPYARLLVRNIQSLDA